MSNKNYHVIFGTGPTGMAVMEELVKKGKQVQMVNRSGNADVPDGVQVTAGDASNPNVTKELCKDADVVYNCTNPPYTKWLELFPALQSGVLEGAADAGAKLVVIDNLYMYGSTNGKPMTEDMPYAATTRKGKLRAKMAEDLMAAHKAGKVRVAVGRASDYFGPRGLTSAMGERVFYPALVGKGAQIMGNVDLPHTQSYIPDIGKGLVILGEREEALGQVWHLPGPKTVTQREFLEMVYKETGYPLKMQIMPKLMLSGLSLFVPIMREVKEMLYEFEEPFVMDHSKFDQAFGNIATPLEEAIVTTVEWFRQNPK